MLKAKITNFDQVCVWPATMVGTERVDEFVSFMSDTFAGVKVQYLGEEKTLEVQVGDDVEGGRNDLFFAVKNDDVMKFSIPRLQYGISWLEDYVANKANSTVMYDEEVEKQLVEYMTWNANDYDDDDV